MNARRRFERMQKKLAKDAAQVSASETQHSTGSSTPNNNSSTLNLTPRPSYMILHHLPITYDSKSFPDKLKFASRVILQNQNFLLST